MLEVVGEAQACGDLGVAKDGGDELPRVELQDAQVLVGAAGGHVGSGGVQLQAQQGSLVPDGCPVVLLLLGCCHVVHPVDTWTGT